MPQVKIFFREHFDKLSKDVVARKVQVYCNCPGNKSEALYVNKIEKYCHANLLCMCCPACTSGIVRIPMGYKVTAHMSNGVCDHNKKIHNVSYDAFEQILSLECPICSILRLTFHPLGIHDN